MSVNRDLWKLGFYDKGQPGWPCPTCKIGSLSFKEESLQAMPTAETIGSEAESGCFDPDAYEGRFSCLMECGRAQCREPVAVTGTYVPEVEDERSGGGWVSYYRPQFVLPAPEMIKLPTECPHGVREEVRGAFTLFWCDLGACLNRIRNAIELVLTDMAVKRYGHKTGGGRVRLPLDSRINILRSKRPELGGLCDRMMPAVTLAR